MLEVRVQFPYAAPRAAVRRPRSPPKSPSGDRHLGRLPASLRDPSTRNPSTTTAPRPKQTRRRPVRPEFFTIFCYENVRTPLDCVAAALSILSGVPPRLRSKSPGALPAKPLRPLATKVVKNSGWRRKRVQVPSELPNSFLLGRGGTRNTSDSESGDSRCESWRPSHVEVWCR